MRIGKNDQNQEKFDDEEKIEAKKVFLKILKQEIKVYLGWKILIEIFVVLAGDYPILDGSNQHFQATVHFLLCTMQCR